MAEASERIYLGDVEVLGYYNDKFVGINTFEEAAPAPPAGWSFRTDANATYLNFGTPGTLITDLGMTYAWSDVSADIRGTGSNLSVLTTNVTSSATYNNFATEGYTESTEVTSTGRLRSSDDTEFEFGSGDFTIETWVNTDGAPNRFLFSDYQVYGPANSQLWFKLNASSIQVLTTISTSEVIWNSSAVSFGTNTWHHVALVRNGSNFQVYFDGTSVLNQTRSGTLNATTRDKFLMGYYNAAGDTVYIQDYRIYKGVAKYTTSFTPPDSMAIYE